MVTGGVRSDAVETRRTDMLSTVTENSGYRVSRAPRYRQISMSMEQGDNIGVQKKQYFQITTMSEALLFPLLN
jgi:hypothetical protein